MPASPEMSATWASPSLTSRQRSRSSASSSARPTKGCQALRPRRLEAADVLRLAKNRPDGNRRVKAFQGSRSKRLQLERAAQEPARGLRDHNGARPGQRLQARRQIGRFADDGLFLRGAPSDKIADHDDSGGDADADIEIFI